MTVILETQQQAAESDGFETAEVVALIDLVHIRTNPDQPRKSFDPEKVQEIAASIKERGQLQPIVLRPVEPVPHVIGIEPGDEGANLFTVFRQVEDDRGMVPVDKVLGEEAAQARADALSAAALEIVMGETRYRAVWLLGRARIKAIVRQYDSDIDAMVDSFSENDQRKDLEPLEEADTFQWLRERGLSLEEIGKRTGRSVPYVSNKLRLNKLPDGVREMIRRKQLTGAHGIAILRFQHHPEIMTLIADQAVKTGSAVRELEKGIPFYYHLQGRGLAANIAGAGIDYKAECKGCPWHALVETEGGNYCLRPSHLTELSEAAKARRQTEIDQAKQRAQEAAKGAAAAPPAAGRRARQEVLPEATLAEATTDDEEQNPPATKAEESNPPAAKPGKPEHVRLSQLPSDSFEVLTPSGMPSGCSEECACRGVALDDRRGGRGCKVTICTRPRRLLALKSKDTRAENAAFDRERGEELARALLAIASAGHHTLLTIVAGYAIQKLGFLALRESAVALGVNPDRAESMLQFEGSLSGLTSEWSSDTSRIRRIAEYSDEQLLKIVAGCIVRKEIAKAIESKNLHYHEATRYLLELAAEADVPAQYEAEEAGLPAQGEPDEADPEARIIETDSEWMRRLSEAIVQDVPLGSQWPSVPGVRYGDGRLYVVTGCRVNAARQPASIRAWRAVPAGDWTGPDPAAWGGETYQGVGVDCGGRACVLAEMTEFVLQDQAQLTAHEIPAASPEIYVAPSPAPAGELKAQTEPSATTAKK